MIFEIEEGIVELRQEAEYNMTGWSTAIDPIVRTPGEPVERDQLWLNTYLSFLPNIEGTVTVGSP